MKNSCLQLKLLILQDQLQEIWLKDMEDILLQIQEIFFIIARGSITETMEHLTTAFDEKYITGEELATGEKKCEIVFKLTNGYIAYLDKSKNQKTVPKPNS